MKTKLNYLLMLLAVMMVMPQGVKAQSVDGLTANQTFDFQSYANQGLSITYGGDYTGFSGNTPKYMQLSDGNDLAGRFASATTNGRHWFLRNNRNPYGLWGYFNLAFCGMWNGDRVRITVAQGSIKFIEANSAKMNGSLVTEGQEATGTVVFAAAKDGDVIISTNGSSSNYTVITKVEFFNSGTGHNGDWTVSFNTSSVSLEGGQTYDTNNANVIPNWVTPTFTSSNNSVATVDEKGVVTAHRKGTATITARMDVGPEGNQWSHHATAEMTVNVTSNEPVDPKYNYDPAIETYDFYWITSDIQSSNLKPAGFNLDYDDYEAQLLVNLDDGKSLNDRIAISQVAWGGGTTPWNLTTDESNRHGLTTWGNWHNMSICNLTEGDRVVIYYVLGDNDNAPVFSSKVISEYNGCAAFADMGNDGEFDEGDVMIQNGMALEYASKNGDEYKSIAYVITEDGHLDIAVPANGRINKIQIYGDHQARMVDRYGDTPSDGNTSYFDTTGQLEAKHHIVPGGLHVYIGNQNDAHHAEVVMSDQGPASFVYDESHFKTPNLPNGSVDRLWYDLPVEGTFYKFVPDVDGTMTVRFKANSINYIDWNEQGNASLYSYGQPNEVSPNVACPYYLMRTDNLYQNHQVQTKGNGELLTFENIEVIAGYTYYIYGWWDDANNYTQYNSHACGVAELIDVKFVPGNYVYPLAKWVKSGATTSNEPELSNLAVVDGYTDVCVKKKSDNIESCSVAIEGGKLIVTSISYKANTNPGGVVLIKVGDKNNDADPVFALTIAYDASFNKPEGAVRSEGHTWNFSENPLNGLRWTNRDSQEATVTNFGTSENANSLLSEEINKGDWTLNYRVKSSNGTTHDMRFLNNYDMEGDNADMIWDTEGLIINAGSTLSCINNEHGVSIDHTNKTQADPDRYVGFLEGGSFIIPKLKKDDRVIIYMGSGSGSGSQAMKFNITNALDAMHNPISPTDEYYVGGSQWNTISGHGDPYYRGCYHFYAAADGDMIFEMAGGSMCKLYSIKIYSGEREETNAVQENGNGYTILATKTQSGTTTGTNSWNLHYRGKGETIADGTGYFSEDNEIIASSASITNTVLNRVSNQGVSYTNQGEIGMIRIRVKCMEYNHNYVTDFADRNMTLALHETKTYPYTWDFTDMKGWDDTATDIAAENTNYDESDDDYESKGRDISIWDENGAMILYGPTWGYVNQNMLFENSKGINGNQLWANDKVIPETKGLWFYMDNNDAAYNGSMQITEEGLRLANTRKMQADGATNLTMGWWNYKMVVPDVPVGAAVYLRMTRDTSVGDGDYSQKPNEDPVYFLNTAYHFGASGDGQPAKTNLTPVSGSNFELSKQADVFNATGNRDSKYSFYKVNGSTDEWIVAVKNTTGAANNLTFTLNGWVLKKLSISEDSKKVNVKGWTTESRNRIIDPALTAFMTGRDMRTYIVTDVEYSKTKKQATLTRIDTDPSDDPKFKDGCLMPVALNGDNNACIILNCTSDGENGIAGEEAKLLDDGFHLFVPDMHDFNITENKEGVKKYWSSYDIKSLMKSQVSSTNGAKTIPAEEGGYTNYAFTCKYYDIDPVTGKKVNDAQALQEGIQAFYRIVGGASSTGNQGYLPIKIEEETNSGNNENNEGGETNPSRAASPARVSSPERFTIVFNNLSDVSLKDGDVNGDGLFNKLDVNTMADRLAGRPTAKFFTGVADMNNDGKVNIVDMTLMIKNITSE